MAGSNIVTEMLIIRDKLKFGKEIEKTYFFLRLFFAVEHQPHLLVKIKMHSINEGNITFLYI